MHGRDIDAHDRDAAMFAPDAFRLEATVGKTTRLGA